MEFKILSLAVFSALMLWTARPSKDNVTLIFGDPRNGYLAKQCFSGSQYCSRDFRALLLTNNCIQSMSRSLAQYTAHVGIMQ